MVISISKKLWENSFSDERIYKAIKKILTWVEDERHRLIFENNIDVDKIIQDQRFYSYSETLKSLVMEQYYSGDNEKKIVRVTENKTMNSSREKSYYNGLLLVEDQKDKSYHYIDVSKIDSYLGKSLYITVENSESDKTFIQTVYKLFRGRELCTEKEVQFLNGGGDTTHQVVIENSEAPVRMICIIDSDKKYPQQEYQKIKDITSTCEERKIELFILKKREIENYIPDETLKSWLIKSNRKSEVSHSYFEMSHAQKSYFDMKKGIKVADLEIKEIKELYDSHIKSDLHIGFGRTVWKAFGEMTKKEQFHNSSDELMQMVEIIDSIK